MTDTTAELEGSCLCGAVKFAFALPVKWVAHCHCSMCRRAHGAPYVTWVSVPTERLRIVAGADALRQHASSATGRRSFCGECGSPLFFAAERWAGETHVARAAVPSDALPRPMMHAFVSDRASWVTLPDDGLPRRGGASGTEPLPDGRAGA